MLLLLLLLLLKEMFSLCKKDWNCSWNVNSAVSVNVVDFTVVAMGCVVTVSVSGIVTNVLVIFLFI